MIAPILPELRVTHDEEPFARREFSSADEVVQGTDLERLMARYQVTVGAGSATP